MNKNILKLYKSIQSDVKDAESYGTGLVGEALIVSSYKQMTIENLEKMQFIIGKILKTKKEMRRVEQAKKKDEP